MNATTPQQRVREFASRVFHRCDGPDEVVPAGFAPDWTDAPARFRTYRGLPHIALPGATRLQRHFDDCRRRRSQGPDGGAAPPALREIALLLQLSLAPLRRKVDLTWNAPDPAIGFLKQEFGRGTASGGGLYPTQAYLVSTGGAPGAGVYHYSSAQHALVPLRPGRFGRWMADALGGAHADRVHPYYLVLAPDFWLNAVKYHNFGLHVCSQDVGAVLATLQLACDALGILRRACTVFDDTAVNRLLGADGEHESAFAVVALGAPREAAADPRCTPLAPVPQPWQKSRHVRLAPEWQAMHRLMLLDAAGVASTLGVHSSSGVDAAPAPEAARPSDDRQAATLHARLPGVLQARRSAWGSLHGPAPIAAHALVGWLRFIWRHGGDAHPPLRERLPEGSLRLVVLAQHVAGVAAGTYRYEPAREGLVGVASAGLLGWQDTYAMQNYNLDDAGCLLFVVADVDAAMDRFGARGYRVLNAHIGVLAQLGYVGAATFGLEGGAVLGARAQQVKRALGLGPRSEVCIAMYVSRARPAVHLFDYSLVPDVPKWKVAA